MRALLILAVLASPALAQPTPFTVADMSRIAEVADPVFDPDGERLVYTVTSEGKDDSKQSDLWSVAWNGGPARRLTATEEFSEGAPRFSADGRLLAFTSDQKVGKDEDTQLWTMPARGGRARRVTTLPGGISDFSLSPDGRQAVVVAEVGVHVGSKAKTKPPIVIDRFQSMEDGRGWLDDRRYQLFRVDLRSGKAVQITNGDFDNLLPSWSPDGRWIAFVSARCRDADRHSCADVYVIPPEGGEPRRISTFDGGDMDADWEAGRPEWSPDSARLVWLRQGDEKLLWYSPFQPVWADVATGTEHPVAWIDRWFYKPRWSADGRSILALVEQDRATQVARIDPDSGAVEYLTPLRRTALDFAQARDGRLAVLDSDAVTPPALRKLEAGLPELTSHNGWLRDRVLAPARDITFRSGDAEVSGFVTLPPEHREGHRHPLIVRLHGGPVSQFAHEFMADWQVYAAQGYAVLAINPRGSSGRGEAFARALFADWGHVDVGDIRAGIDHVIASGVADPERIGVGGWSYGGILTNYMIASDPRIKAAVSGAGMANFIGGYGADQYARDYEIELGTPWEQIELWGKLSYPFFEPGRITAPTLYLCAEDDRNVPCTGSEQMYQALRSRGVPTRLVVYPGETHGLSVPSYIRDRMQRHLDWYARYLRPAQ